MVSGQNGPAHGSEPLSSFAPVGQNAGIWRVVAGKCTRAPWSVSRTGQNQFLLASHDGQIESGLIPGTQGVQWQMTLRK